CETGLPTTVVGPSGTSIPGWTQQSPGVAGYCTQGCVVGAADGGSCPVNSTCQTGSAAGPDCIP
ncbi:MAG: hypothetical protein ACRELB_18525, partial [Polyangiaceae bacterium]